MSAKPQPLENVPPQFESAAAHLKAALGFVPNSLLTLLRKPQLAKAVMPSFAYLSGDDCSIDRQFRPLIAYMASLGAGCRYCQAHNSHAALLGGVPEEKVAELWRYDESELFDARERAALSFAFAAGQQPNGVGQQHFEDMAEHFSEEEILDIAGIVSIFGFLNRWNDSMATALEDSPAASARETLMQSGWEAGKHSS